MFYVESSNFYDDLMSGKMQMLNKQGVDEVIKIIKSKENIIEEVREYIEKHIAMFKNGDMLVDMNIDEFLKILDKENQDDKN